MQMQTARGSKHVCRGQALSCTTNSLHPRHQRANQPHGMHPKPMPQRAVKRECAAERGESPPWWSSQSLLLLLSQRHHHLARPTRCSSAASPDDDNTANNTPNNTPASDSESDNHDHCYTTVNHPTLTPPRCRGLAVCLVQPCNHTPQSPLGGCRASSAAWLTGHTCAICSLTACWFETARSESKVRHATCIQSPHSAAISTPSSQYSNKVESHPPFRTPRHHVL